MKWANGDLGRAPDQLEASVTALPEKLEHLRGLENKLFLLGILTGIALVLQVAAHYYWKFRANKGFYIARKSLTIPMQCTAFWKMPVVFVFPSIFLLIFKFFVTGLVMDSVALLVTPSASCDMRCNIVAIMALLAATAFVGLGWFVVIDFNFRFRKVQWKMSKEASSASLVDDPFYRGVSLLRSHVLCLGKEDPRSILERSQGKYAAPPHDTIEPARTERLIKHPCLIWKRKAGDVLQAYQLAYFPLSGGKTCVALCFDMILLTLQLGLGMVSGIGSAGVWAGRWAQAQVQVIFSVQFFITAYVWCLFPAHDRADNIMVALQFGLEGANTALLFHASQMSAFPETKAAMQSFGFCLSISALAVPLLRRGYDGIIVQCVKARRKGPFNRKAALLAFIVFYSQLQSTIFKLFGINSSQVSSTGAGVVQAAKVLNREAVSGLAALIEAGQAFSADVFAVYFGAPPPKLERAASRIQTLYRTKVAVVKRFRAAILLQRCVRRWIVRRQFRAYRSVQTFFKGGPDESFDVRPGYEWLQREELLLRCRDRIDRIRKVQHAREQGVREFERQAAMKERMTIFRSLAQNGSSLSPLSFPRTSFKHRLPPPPGLPPLLLAPAQPKPWSRVALSTTSLDGAEQKERSDVMMGTNSLSAIDAKIGVIFRPTRSIDLSSTHLTRSRPAALQTARTGLNTSSDVQHKRALDVSPALTPPPRASQEPDSAPVISAKVHLHSPMNMLWHNWLKPAALIFLGYAFVGTKTFPQAEREKHGERKPEENEKRKGKEDIDDDADGDGDGGGDGGD